MSTRGEGRIVRPSPLLLRVPVMSGDRHVYPVTVHQCHSDTDSREQENVVEEQAVPEFDLDAVPERDRERVAALIPDPRIAEAYKHRTVHGVEDFDLFDMAVEERENIILAGPTGSSKTSAFRAYAAARGLPFALVECNAAMDPGTVLGRTAIDSEGGVSWIDGDFTLVVRYGGVALIDEVNLAHPRITAGFHQLLAVTRAMGLPEAGETVKAARWLLLGAAFNPRYQGTIRLNEAFANRFPIALDWGYERAVEEQLIRSGRLLDMADGIRSLAEIRTPVSTNALMEFERHADRLGMEFASGLLVNRFAPEERNPVSRALEANAEAIERELFDEESEVEA